MSSERIERFPPKTAGIIVAVCGGRNYHNTTQINSVLDEIHKTRGIIRVNHGGAMGADSAAAMWAYGKEIDVYRFAAAWERLGISAGPARNHRMMRDGDASLLVVLPGGDGTGTADCIGCARKFGIEVMEVPAL